MIRQLKDFVEKLMPVKTISVQVSKRPAATDIPETIEVATSRVACDGSGKGGDATLGHPRVYLEMGDEDFVECPYCDKRFVLKDGARHSH